MAGLLYPAYQKFYSALCSLERFEKDQNFFDNISSIDSFFSEFRSITFVLQKSLAHTKYKDYYHKLIGGYFDPWLNKQRTKTIHTHPFEMIKKLDINVYFPDTGITVYTNEFTVENDMPLSSIQDKLKKFFIGFPEIEIFFSAKFSFIEKDSGEDLWDKVLAGITSMQEFMENLYVYINEKCALCEELRERIKNNNIAFTPKDILLINDYVYYPQKDVFYHSQRIALDMSFEGIKKQRHSLNDFNEHLIYSFDGTTFGAFVCMHVFIRTLQQDVMPTVMLVYEDDTYTIESFYGSLKTTFYRKVNEIADIVNSQNIKEVYFLNTYLYIPVDDNITMLTTEERAKKSTTEFLTCIFIDCNLKTREYSFDVKHINNAHYIEECFHDNDSDKLKFGVNNMQPIIRAFEKRLNGKK